MRSGAWTQERLVPLRKSGRVEGDSSRATQAYTQTERVALTPRGVGGILDTAWEIYSERFLQCVGLTLALTLPMRASLVAVRYSGVERTTRHFLEFALDRMAPVLVAVLVANLVRDYVYSRSTSTWGSVRATFDRLPSLLGILVILALGFFCLPYTLLCFPISLYLYWQLSIAPAVYAIEGRSLIQVFRRGVRLLRGWTSFGRFLGIAIVHFVMFFGLAGSMIALDDPTIRAAILEFTEIDGLTLDLLATVPASIFMAVSSAFLAIVLSVYYYDIRARREGLDLHLQLEEIEAAHRASELESDSPPARSGSVL